VEKLIAEIDPDCIITIGESEMLFPEICFAPSWLRIRWLHRPSVFSNLGDEAYHTAMMSMIEGKKEFPLISIITPIRNIGETLRKTYSSVAAQTWWNWEWILVNDGDDELTGEIAKELAAAEPRIKYYDIHPRSHSRVGEAKYRAANLCHGYILAELDHDDYLTSDCTELLYKASQQHPEIGFFYTDSAEINENYESLRYDPGFALGYGKYENVESDGMKYDSCISSNINPKTIRHIVGVPNHIRAWRRDVYHQIGGHNRGLSVADDYELIIRTFLNTIMMRIPKLGYLQFMHSSNTTDLSRKDIQRRVRTIMYYYNDKIAERFKELGVEDYCYNTNPDSPLSVESRFGINENYVNKIYKL
jgi:glycosyltransferase involved in cell wall biosynthesis